MSRLDDFGIRLVSEGPVVSVYVRDECIAAVGAASEAVGTTGAINQGSTGLMTEQGLAYLVWRDGLPFLAARGVETPATPEQVAAIQKFSQDLANALSTA